ncbi:hypothetical protein TRFO_13430 [Tritrichomonas foetus]|uniref:Wntless-like transmembrane domain-containing protein n=1 Tax=Tritrichomonas foetus TaxID=1144522 RepID=A0A1J4L2E4_9EUKA|nr:hypothetical protein TRFO_13430 [Tritrichomonas foetus]|eukprot:OHT16110.1 hypothetical protein TRFO_13430 [Tritrichomonas foetus]
MEKLRPKYKYNHLLLNYALKITRGKKMHHLSVQFHTSPIPILVILFFMGSLTMLYVPDSKEIQYSTRAVERPNDTIYLSTRLTQISPLTNYFYGEVIFERVNDTIPLHRPFQYEGTILTFLNEQNYRHFSVRGEIHPVTPTRKSLSTAPHRIFLERYIRYDDAKIDIKIIDVPKDAVKSILLKVISGNPQYNHFLLLMKILFFFLNVNNLYEYLKYARNELNPLIIALITIHFLANNPLVYFHNYRQPLKVYYLLDDFAQALQSAFLRIYLLIIFTNIRDANSQLSKLPTTFFFFALFFSFLSHNFNTDSWKKDYTDPVTSFSTPILAFELGIEMSYITWLIVTVSASFSKVKRQSQQKTFKLFASALFSISFFLIFTKIMNNYVLPSRYKFSEEAVSFVCSNMMIYIILQISMHATKEVILPYSEPVDDLPKDFALVPE